MIGSERFLSNSQSIVEQRSRFFELRLITIDQGENIQHRRHIRIYNDGEQITLATITLITYVDVQTSSPDLPAPVDTEVRRPRIGLEKRIE